MASILHHAALGFAMGAGSFVLAALPSHGSDARVSEPASSSSSSSSGATPASPAKPAPTTPAIDVTAPIHESTGLRALRSRKDDGDEAAPLPRASRDALDPAFYDEESAPSSCRMSERRPRHGRLMAASPRMHEARLFAHELRMPVEMPVRKHPRVLQYVRHFTETPEGRATFRAWLSRSGKYEGLVSRALEERGLPAGLMAVVFVESGCVPSAVSSAGAAGLWQLMPQTARAYGLSVDDEVDERHSLAPSTRAATDHLADLYDRFGSWDLALAAYNMGYKALLSRIDTYGTDDFWELAEVEGALPSETAHYVPKVLAAALVLANLDELGFGEESEDSENEVADRPFGRVDRAARLARTGHTGRMGHDGAQNLVYFRAAAGDTAATIARTFGMKPAQVLAQNGLDEDDELEEGTLLRLRVPKTVTRRLSRAHARDERNETEERGEDDSAIP